MPLEAILAQLRRGLACYETHSRRPTILAGVAGLTPALPSVLGKLGYFTLDGGRFHGNEQDR